jgi:hypothetical protein
MSDGNTFEARFRIDRMPSAAITLGKVRNGSLNWGDCNQYRTSILWKSAYMLVQMTVLTHGFSLEHMN